MYLMHSQINPFVTALSTTQVVKGSVQGITSHGSVIKSGFVVASSVVVVVFSVVVVGFSVVIVVVSSVVVVVVVDVVGTKLQVN